LLKIDGKGIKISKSEKYEKPLKNQGVRFDFYQLWDDNSFKCYLLMLK